MYSILVLQGIPEKKSLFLIHFARFWNMHCSGNSCIFNHFFFLDSAKSIFWSERVGEVQRKEMHCKMSIEMMTMMIRMTFPVLLTETVKPASAFPTAVLELDESLLYGMDGNVWWSPWDFSWLKQMPASFYFVHEFHYCINNKWYMAVVVAIGMKMCPSVSLTMIRTKQNPMCDVNTWNASFCFVLNHRR